MKLLWGALLAGCALVGGAQASLISPEATVSELIANLREDNIDGNAGEALRRLNELPLGMIQASLEVGMSSYLQDGYLCTLALAQQMDPPSADIQDRLLQGASRGDYFLPQVIQVFSAITGEEREEASRRLHLALSDEWFIIRRLAARILVSSYREPLTPQLMTELLRSHQLNGIAGGEFETLITMQREAPNMSPEVREALREQLRNESLPVRPLAAQGLLLTADCPTGEVAEALISCLAEEAKPHERQIAQDLLAELLMHSTESVIRPLEFALMSEDRRVRQEVGRLLANNHRIAAGSTFRAWGRLDAVLVDALGADDVRGNTQAALDYFEANPDRGMELLGEALDSADLQQRFNAACLLGLRREAQYADRICEIMAPHLVDDEITDNMGMAFATLWWLREAARDQIAELANYDEPQVREVAARLLEGDATNPAQEDSRYIHEVRRDGLDMNTSYMADMWIPVYGRGEQHQFP